MRSRWTPPGLTRPTRVGRVPPKPAPYAPLLSPRSSWRRVPARYVPASALDGDHEHDRSAKQQTREPVPGQDQPILNSAVRSEWGHHMYSTGKFATGLESSGCSQGTLKLYSHGPIEESTCSRSHQREFRQLFQADTQLLSGSAWSACYYLYLIALRSLCSQDTSRDAHSQIFSPSPGRLGALTSRPRSRIGGSPRVRNLLCRLGRSADNRNGFSRPFLSFQAASPFSTGAEPKENRAWKL